MRRAPLAVLLLLGAAGLAHGHAFEPSVVALLDRGGGVFDVVWRQPATVVAEAVVPGGGPGAAPILPAHCREVVRPVSGGPGEPVLSRVDCGPTGLRGAAIGMRGLAGGRADVIVRIAWRDGDVTTGIIRSDADVVRVSALGRGAPLARVLRGYGALGVEHIMTGIDHLLFVLCLVLLVGPGWRLVETVTAFTLAHSCSLALAVLDVVRVPAAPVEALIAASILLVAVEVVRPPGAPTLAQRRPWLVAFGFGLLHGLGFAGALAEIGIPADRVGAALLAFNVGVEVGQLAFVGALLAAGRLARRLTGLPMPRGVTAYAAGAVAAAWTVERVLAFLPP